MKKMILVALLFLTNAALAGTQVSSAYSIGRMVMSGGQIELKGLTVQAEVENEKGDTVLKTVKAQLYISSDEASAALLLLKKEGAKVSIMYEPSSVEETEDCLGSDLQYQRVTKNDDGTKDVESYCYEVTPSEIIIH